MNQRGMADGRGMGMSMRCISHRMTEGFLGGRVDVETHEHDLYVIKRTLLKGGPVPLARIVGDWLESPTLQVFKLDLSGGRGGEPGTWGSLIRHERRDKYES